VRGAVSASTVFIVVLNGPFALALVSGMVATVNPCGFALLPAYLSAFVGMNDRSGRVSGVGRAIAVSAVLTAGFITVFGILGVVFGSALNEVQRRAPWVTIVIGVALVGLGISMLSGRELNLRIPKLQRGGSDGTLVSMYLFGVSYALASLSCAIAPFLTVTSSPSANLLSRIVTFTLYGVGMGLVITVLTVAVALARSGVVARFRSFVPHMNRIAGGLMVVAGAYVAYYGWYEWRVLEHNDTSGGGLYERAQDIQVWVLGRMPTTHNYGWYLLGAATVIAAAVLWSRRPRSQGPQPAPVDEPVSV
jgi:cytochrome c-type biogenesis protein